MLMQPPGNKKSEKLEGDSTHQAGTVRVIKILEGSYIFFPSVVYLNST